MALPGLAAIKDGSADVLFSGTWSAKDVKEALGDNYAATSLPTFTVNGQKNNPNAKNPKAAAQFAAYLGSTEAQKLHYEMRAILPTDKSLSDLTTDDVAAKAQADTMANTAPPAVRSVWHERLVDSGRNLRQGPGQQGNHQGQRCRQVPGLGQAGRWQDR